MKRVILFYVGSRLFFFLQASSSSDGGFTFEFYVSASDMGSAIAIIPQSSTYLFTPTSHIFQFDGEICSSH